MPPRYAYWTILIDGQPTAFRAREREELVPTLVQLRRTNPQTEMRWFANGRLWDSPEQAQWARRHAAPARERRDRDWRPGGAHRDPRARFDKARGPKRPRRPGPGASAPERAEGPDGARRRSAPAAKRFEGGPADPRPPKPRRPKGPPGAQRRPQPARGGARDPRRRR